MLKYFRYSNPDFFIFSLIFLIVWVPLPWASNRDWASLFFVMIVLLLSCRWLWLFLRGKVYFSTAFKRSGWMVALWLLWLIYLGVQLVPLPIDILEILSPYAADAHRLLNNNRAYAPITLDWFSTALAWLHTLAYFLLFSLILLVVRTEKHIRWLAYTLVISGVFQALYGSLMTLSGAELGFFYEKIHYRGVATGTFVNRNHFAAYLVLCLSLGIGLLIAQLRDHQLETWRQRLRHLLNWLFSGKMLLRLCLVFMVIGLVLTHSRMGNSSFFAALLLASIITLVLSRHAPRAMSILLISFIVIDIVIIGTWFGLEKVAQRLQQTSIEKETRDDVGLETLRYVDDYWLTGSGLGSYYAVFPPYQEKNSGKNYYDHAHNDYLEFAAETGLIGIGLIGLMAISSFILALFTLYRRHTPIFRGIAFAATMAMIALFIHSSVDFSLQIPAVAASFVILIALLWLVAHMPRKPQAQQLNKKEIHIRETSIVIFLLPSLLSILILTFIGWLADFHYRQAKFYVVQWSQKPQQSFSLEQWQTAQEAISKALRLNSYHADYQQLAGQIQLIYATELAQTAKTQTEAGEWAMEYFRKTIHLRPVSARSWAYMALAKSALWRFDAEFQKALHQAGITAEWDFKFNRQVIVRTGIQSWLYLSDAAKADVITALSDDFLAIKHYKKNKHKPATLLHQFERGTIYWQRICTYPYLPGHIKAFCLSEE